MKKLKPQILVITPVKHIPGVADLLEEVGDVTYLEDPDSQDLLERISDCTALYTNPNKARVFISREIMERGSSLQVICTASTGTTHIDMECAERRGVSVLSLKEERDVINRISSTAEHAFALMMSALRRVPAAYEAVKAGQWDYLPYIGRQLDHLTIGVVGYGRLGTLFADYCRVFRSRVLVYDPYQTVDVAGIEQVELATLLAESDVISLHVHVTPETREMVGERWLSTVKPDVIHVNTSRGEICCERALEKFLRNNPGAIYATDVLAEETERDLTSNNLVRLAREGGQVIITPHIAGMTREGQMIAYQHAAERLKLFFEADGS